MEKTWRELQENLSYCNLAKREGHRACHACEQKCKHSKLDGGNYEENHKK